MLDNDDEYEHMTPKTRRAFNKKIEGEHLGSGKQYETPNEITPSLLVGVPRELNRKQYGIKYLTGYDVWNCYEFSTLLKNGLPVVGVLKLVYSSYSKYIVESKSLKLYLNSFNKVRWDADTPEDLLWRVEQQVKEDLAPVVGENISVILHSDDRVMATPIVGPFQSLDDRIGGYDEFKESDKENPDLIRLIKLDHGPAPFYIKSSLLRSNCRVTNQPDWGDIYIYWLGESVSTYNDFLQYIVSFRNENHFHEEVVEMVYQRFMEIFKPKELFVAAMYTRRGGIDINPVRATSNSLIVRLANGLINPLYLTHKSIRH